MPKHICTIFNTLQSSWLYFLTFCGKPIGFPSRNNVALDFPRNPLACMTITT